MKYKYNFKMNIMIMGIIVLILHFYYFFITKNLEKKESVSSILDLTTSHAGYNALMLHGTIYCSFFLGVIIINLTPINTQILTRMERTIFLKKNIFQIVMVSICFVLCFSFVFILKIISIYDYSFLEEINFFLGLYIYIILFISLYMILGSIYLFFEILFNDKMYSFFITLICSTILVCLNLIARIWTPFADMDVFDQLFIDGIDILKVTVKFLQNIVIYSTITYMTMQIFKIKDITK